MQIVLLVIAGIFLYDTAFNLSSIVAGNSGIPVKLLRVTNVKVFKNYFPNLSVDENDERNQRLGLRGGGLFFHSYTFLPDGVCQTTILSGSSFEIVCEKSVRAHGFWVQVSGSPTDGDVPTFGYAAVQYAVQLWQHEQGHASNLSDPSWVAPESSYTERVPGTSHWVRGSLWVLKQSQSQREGTYLSLIHI